MYVCEYVVAFCESGLDLSTILVHPPRPSTPTQIVVSAQVCSCVCVYFLVFVCA